MMTGGTIPLPDDRFPGYAEYGLPDGTAERVTKRPWEWLVTLPAKLQIARPSSCRKDEGRVLLFPHWEEILVQVIGNE